MASLCPVESIELHISEHMNMNMYQRNSASILISENSVCMLCGRRIPLFVTPWTVACQALLSLGFLRQEYWGGIAISSSRGSS